MPAKVRLHQIERVNAAVAATLAVGTVPAGDGPRIVSLVLVAVGLTIIGRAGAVIVEAVAGGVITGALGADRVVRPYTAAGRVMANLVPKPRETVAG